MTIDERIEALTQSLELLASLHRDLENQAAQRAAETDRRFADSYRDQQQDAANIHSLTLIASDALDSIKRLERVATAHQGRLDDHEQRIEDLEGE